MITLQEYRYSLKRLEKAEAYFDAHPNDPRYPILAEEYSKIMEGVLEYEHEHKIDWARFHDCPYKNEGVQTA